MHNKFRGQRRVRIQSVSLTHIGAGLQCSNKELEFGLSHSFKSKQKFRRSAP